MKRIKLGNNGFERINDKGQRTYLGSEIEVKLLAVQPGFMRVFYSAEFDPNAKVNEPSCYSWHGEFADPLSPNRQSSTCGECAVSRSCVRKKDIIVKLLGEGYVVTLNAGSLFMRSEYPGYKCFSEIEIDGDFLGRHISMQHRQNASTQNCIEFKVWKP